MLETNPSEGATNDDTKGMLTGNIVSLVNALGDNGGYFVCLRFFLRIDIKLLLFSHPHPRKTLPFLYIL